MGILFLIGPRGSGKSLIAKLLEAPYECRVIDTDKLILQTTGKTVAAIVEEGGWEAFRKHEKEALREALTLLQTAPEQHGIVATGGGMVLDPDNRAFMRENGTVVYLHAQPEELIARLGATQNGSLRPPLSGLRFEEEIRETVRLREPLYRDTAHHVVDASLAPETVARIAFETMTKTNGR